MDTTAGTTMGPLSLVPLVPIVSIAAAGGSMCWRTRQHFRDPRRLDHNQLYLQLDAWRDDETKWKRHVGMSYSTYLIILKHLRRWESEMPKHPRYPL